MLEVESIDGQQVIQSDISDPSLAEKIQDRHLIVATTPTKNGDCEPPPLPRPIAAAPGAGGGARLFECPCVKCVEEDRSGALRMVDGGLKCL
jgi:hypothetical protein